MALATDETRHGAEVIDSKTGALKVAAPTTTLINQGVAGVRRDADGRLLVQNLSTGDPGAKVA